MGKNEETRYGVQTSLGGIICTNGDTHHSQFVGPGQWSPKLWKTRGGAQRVADRYNQTRLMYVVGSRAPYSKIKRGRYTVYVVDEGWGAYPPGGPELLPQKNFSKLEEALGKALDHLAQNDAQKGLTKRYK